MCLEWIQVAQVRCSGGVFFCGKCNANTGPMKCVEFIVDLSRSKLYVVSYGHEV
jgi:hypothetical protein